MLIVSAGLNSPPEAETKFELLGSYIAFRDEGLLEPAIRRQNTRVVAGGLLALDYRIVDGILRFRHEGVLPWQLVADYCWNTAADTDNKGLWLALVLGSTRSARSRFEYVYAKVDKDATLAAYATDDFFWGTGWEGHRGDLGVRLSENTAAHGVAQIQRFKDSPRVARARSLGASLPRGVPNQLLTMRPPASTRAMLAATATALAAFAMAPVRAAPPAVVAALEGDGIRVEFDDVLRSRVVAIVNGVATPLGPFSASGVGVRVGRGRGGVRVRRARGEGRRGHVRPRPPPDRAGPRGGAGQDGRRHRVRRLPRRGRVRGPVRERAERRPARSTAGPTTATRCRPPTPPGTPAFWSYQGGSYESRPDWVLPLTPGFAQDNFQGMNATDYGGGTPVVDVWRRDVGLAVGHLELAPRPVSLPVGMPSATEATVAVRRRLGSTLAPGETHRDAAHVRRRAPRRPLPGAVALPAA